MTDPRLAQAQVYNYAAGLSLAAAETHGPFFYEEARLLYGEAIALCDEWFQPYENLGDVLRYLGQVKEREFDQGAYPTIQDVQDVAARFEELGSLDFHPGYAADEVMQEAAREVTARREAVRSEAEDLQRQSIAEYEKALVRFDASNRNQPNTEVVRQRIEIGAAASKMLTRDAALQREAITTVAAIERRIEDAASESRTSKTPLDETPLADASLFYNLATWHAVSARTSLTDETRPFVATDNSRQRALRYLIYTIRRDSTGAYLDGARHNPALGGLGEEATRLNRLPDRDRTRVFDATAALTLAELQDLVDSLFPLTSESGD